MKHLEDNIYSFGVILNEYTLKHLAAAAAYLAPSGCFRLHGHWQSPLIATKSALHLSATNSMNDGVADVTSLFVVNIISDLEFGPNSFHSFRAKDCEGSAFRRSAAWLRR